MNAFHRRTIERLSWCNTDEAMAELCGVSRSTVFRYRVELDLMKNHRYTTVELRVVKDNYLVATDKENAEDLRLTEGKAQYLRRDLAGLRVEEPHMKRVYA